MTKNSFAFHRKFFISASKDDEIAETVNEYS